MEAELGPGENVVISDGPWKEYEGRTVGEVSDNCIRVEVPGLDATVRFPVRQVARRGEGSG